MSFEHKIGAPYEELSTVKVVGNNVLLLHTITASEDAVKYDSNNRLNNNNPPC